MRDVSGRRMLEMLDSLFAYRRVVDSRDVKGAAEFYDLGTDGRRAVRALASGIYTRDSLYDALVDAILDDPREAEAVRAMVPRTVRIHRPAGCW